MSRMLSQRVFRLILLFAMAVFAVFAAIPESAHAGSTITLQSGNNTTQEFSVRADSAAKMKVGYSLTAGNESYSLKLNSMTYRRPASDAVSKTWSYTVTASYNLGSSSGKLKGTADGGKGYGSINSNFTGGGTATFNRGTTSQTITVSLSYKATASNGSVHTDTHYLKFTVPARTSYQVEYNANGGTNAPGNQTKFYNIDLTLTSDEPTLTGYHLASWNKNADGSGQGYGKGAIFRENAITTLYAQWAANPYTVSFDANGGIGSMPDIAGVYDQDIDLPENTFSNEGLSFYGWSTTPSEEPSYQDMDRVRNLTNENNGHVTLYAQWVDPSSIMSTVSGEAVFTNVKVPRSGVCVTKVSSANGNVLEGAKFVVEPAAAHSGRSSGIIYGDDGNQVPSIEITTGPDGVGQTRSEALSANANFRIREIAAPPGYAIDDPSWKEFVSSGDAGQIVAAGNWSDTPLTTTAEISALKIYSMPTGKSSSEKLQIGEGEFTFRLRSGAPDGVVIATVSTPYSDTGSSTVSFPPISYTAEDIGAHEYWVTEDQPDTAGVSIAEPRKVVVNVSEVQDNSGDYIDRKLHAEVVPDVPGTSGATVNMPNISSAKFDVEVYKEDADTALPLRGATFAVFEIAPIGDGEPALPDVFKSIDAFNAVFVPDDKKRELAYDDEQLSESAGIVQAQLIETDETGHAKTLDGGLDAGKAYAVIEVKAPIGFMLPDTPTIYVIDDYAPDGHYSHVAVPTISDDGDGNMVSGSAQANFDSNGNSISTASVFDSDRAWSGYKVVLGGSSAIKADEPFIFDNKASNANLGGLGVRKVDLATGAGVAGAEFMIFDEDKFQEKYAEFKESRPNMSDAEFLDLLTTRIIEDSDGIKSINPGYLEPEEAFLDSSGEDGWTETTVRSLEPGRYRVIETKAPFEYDPPEYDFSAEGGNNGSVTVEVEKDKITRASLEVANHYDPKVYETRIQAMKSMDIGKPAAGAFQFALYSDADEMLEHPLTIASNSADGTVDIAKCSFRSATKTYELQDADGESVIESVSGISETTQLEYKMKEIVPDDAVAMMDGERFIFSEYAASHSQEEIESLVWIKDKIMYDTRLRSLTVTIDLDTEDEDDVLTVSFEDDDREFVNLLDIEQPGLVRVKKVDDNTNEPLIGTTFAIDGITASGVGIHLEFDTDEDGIAETQIPYGSNYTIYELVPPDNHDVNRNWDRTFSISEQESVADFTDDGTWCADPESEPVSFPVAKYWRGGEVTEESVEMALIGETENSEIIEFFELKAEDGWKGRSPEVPKFDEYGDEYEYRIEESSNLPKYEQHAATGADPGELDVLNQEITSLTISKAIAGKTSKTPPDGLRFSFTLELTDEQGAVLDGTFPLTFPDGTQGKFTSGNTLLLAEGDQVKIERLPYGTKYALTENSTENYALSASVTGSAVSVSGNTVSGQMNGDCSVALTNTYSTTGNAEVKVEKTISGREWIDDDSFEFTIVPFGSAPAFSNPTVRIGKDTPGHTASFGTVSLSAEGTYQWKVSETHKGETVDGITYYGEDKTVTVVVEDDGHGNLVASSGSNLVQTAEFNNSYRTSGAGEIKVMKNLSGRDWTSDDSFEFTIVPFGSAPAFSNPIASVTSSTPGHTASFGHVIFTRVGQYTYTVTESHQGQRIDGIDYAIAPKTVTISVEDDGHGHLVASGNSNLVQTVVFDNDYNPEGEGEIRVAKSLSGRDWAEDDSFEFTISPLDGAPMPDGPATISGGKAQLASGGTISFGKIPFTEPGGGTYRWKINETHKGQTIDGLAYDSEEKIVTIVVEDNGKGNLVAASTSTLVPTANFANCYSSETSVVPEIAKTLENRDIADGEFKFSLTGNGQNQTATNIGNKVVFSPIEYDQDDAGKSYTYTIAEIAGNDPSVAYSTKTCNYTVTLTDDGKGHLTATESYDGAAGKPEFVNTVAKIGTQASDAGDGDKVVSQDDVQGPQTVKDIVSYSGLRTGESYTLRARLVGDGDKDIPGASKSESFVPDSPDGTYEIRIPFDVSKYEGERAVVFEALYLDSDDGEPVAVHEDPNDLDQTVSVVKIATTATDSSDDDKFISPDGRQQGQQTVRDVVSYSGLDTTKTYTMSAWLVDREGTPIPGASATKTFEPVASKGSEPIDIPVDLSAVDFAELVAFEELYQDSDLIAQHKNPGDESQTVYVVRIATKAANKANNTKYVSDDKPESVISDEVSYSGLLADRKYRMEARLVYKDTGSAVGEFSGTAEFTAKESSGLVTVEIPVNPSECEFKEIVVFERLIDAESDKTIAVHEEVQDEAQTVRNISIRTSAADGLDDDKYIMGGDAIIKDTVSYNGLESGHGYKLTAVLADKASGKLIADADGNPLSGTAEFSAQSGDGTQVVEIPVPIRDAKGELALAAGDVVAFETLCDADSPDTPIAEHKDIDDQAQTVHHAEIETVAENAADSTKYLIDDGNKKTRLADTVSYSGLVPGHEYILETTLMDRFAKEPVAGVESARSTFTAEESPSRYRVEYEYDSSTWKTGDYVFFEKVYDGETGNLVASHEDLYDDSQVVYYMDSAIRTVATDASDGDKHIGTSATVNDKVEYVGLSAGMAYRLDGTLMNKETGEEVINSDGNPARGSTEFTVEEGEEDGSVIVPISVEVDSPIAAPLVVFETLTAIDSADGRQMTVAEHKDLSDHDQTVFQPAIGTVAHDGADGDGVIAESAECEIIDSVEYTGFDEGSYVLRTSLYDKTADEMVPLTNGDEYSNSSFTFAGDGSVEVPVSFDGKGRAGHELVVFEEVYTQEMILVAEHRNPDDEKQTVSVYAENGLVYMPLAASGDSASVLVSLAGLMAASAATIAAIRKRGRARRR